LYCSAKVPTSARRKAKAQEFTMAVRSARNIEKQKARAAKAAAAKA
jgi:hypothetical protein